MMMPSDVFGRTVELEVIASQDVYTVFENSVGAFVITVVAGTPVEQVYETINSMAPAGYVPPEPSTEPE